MNDLVLTPELRIALARQPGRPLRLVDPETNATYLVVAEKDLGRLTANASEKSGPSPVANSDADGSAEHAPESFPAVGTPEWGQMNQRRAELIRKKVRGELTEAERRQYEWLQRKSLEALDAVHPRTTSGDSVG
jgi:hypothetical protein